MRGDTDETNKRHAKYGGSNAHRWLRCTVSAARAMASPPRPTSEWALEGQRAHAMLEKCLSAIAYNSMVRPYNMPQRGPISPRAADPTAPEEMFRAVTMVLEYVNGILAVFPNALVFVEQYEEFPTTLLMRGEAGGTADVFIYDEESGLAWVIDLKYGEGVRVVAPENEQLLFYATQCLWYYGFTKATLTIIQPRTPYGDPITETQVTGLDLIQFHARCEDAFLAAAMFPEARPGEWCKWCEAELTCPEREAAALQVVHTHFATVKHVDPVLLPHPEDIALDRIGLILESAPLLRSWLKAVEDYAEIEAKNGKVIPGHKLVMAQARRKWDGDELLLAQQLLKLLGGSATLDDVMPRGLIGITDAEKMLSAFANAHAPEGSKRDAVKRIKEQFAFLTTKTSSGNLTLVPLSDERPAVDLGAAMFTGVVIPPPSFMLGNTG